MKRFLPTFLLIILVLAFYPFIGKDDSSKSVEGLPWQIEILSDGSTRVFGLTLGQSNLGDAVDLLGDDMELAVMVGKDQRENLEMYYPKYRAGLLGGKLVLAADLDAAAVTGFRINAVNNVILGSGARKYLLKETDRERAYQAVIDNIAFIPAVNLDHDIIIKRFGEPLAIIHSSNEAMHYLYPEKGLDVMLNEQGKEVLQYVSPDVFVRLSGPLKGSAND